MARVIPIEAAAAAGAAAAPAATDARAVRYFRNYTQMRPLVPRALWWLARALALAAACGVIALLWLQPALGLRVFWGIAIPAVPALLVLAPGLWRQVCPMATLNQLPRTLGLSRGRDLPDWARNWAFTVALGLFITAVALRQPWLNHSAAPVAVGVAGVLVLALAGGWAFKGRSGWCGTFCPLGPIQRTYGQAPLVMVRNGHCEPCVGCQKNCYDFNPRAAIFSDVYDEDPRYAAQRRLFMGLLPGLLLGYFLAPVLQVEHEAARLGLLLGAAATSAGLYGLGLAFLPVNAFRLSLVFGALAISIFYFFAGPLMVHNLAALAGHEPDRWAADLTRSLGAVLALSLAANGLRAERRYQRVAAARAQPPAAQSQRPAAPGAASRLGGGRSLKDRLAQSEAVEVTDRETGITFQAASDATLLESIERAGLKIAYGCRAGVCGADPVVVCDGAEHLSPMGDDERATLRRLGLDRRARLACMCTVAGPVTIDRDARSAAGAGAQPATVVGLPPKDRALGTGVRQVVIVGNGIAGMSVAEGLRRGSPSMDITVVTHEPHRFYNRMGIGRLVYDSDGMDSLHLVPPDWAEHHRVTVMQGTVAARIDIAERRLGLGGGRWLPYDRLVLATGARAALPDPGFLNHDNAFVLRNADDAQSIRAYVQNTRARRAVVLGGGVLGVEAADALHKLGLRVTLLHRGDTLMNAQLDERGAAVLAAYLESIGVQVVTGVQVTRFEGEGDITAAWLAHGPRVRADVFVACLGIQPNVHLAAQAGLVVGSGIRVDQRMVTSEPHVLAAGDCAEPDNLTAKGLWPIGAAQAGVIVETIFNGEGRFSAGPQVVQLKCDGIDVRSLGDPRPRPGDDVLQSPAAAESCWRFVLRDQAMVGGLLVGPPGSARPFMKLVQDPALLAAGLPALRAGDLVAAAAGRA